MLGGSARVVGSKARGARWRRPVSPLKSEEGAGNRRQRIGGAHALARARGGSLDFARMKISKRGEYALRALIDLGIARELGRPMLRAQEIVARENLHKGFLDQILMQLRKAGFVGTKRGKNGGYFLNQPMDSIAIGQVIRLIDGPLAPIRCVSQTGYKKCSCPDEATCGLRSLMFDVRNAVADILDRHTLADAVHGSLAKMRSCGMRPPYAQD